MALPKAQEYPASRIKVGTVLYRACAYTDYDRKTTSEIEEWIVRSIKAKRGSKSRYGAVMAGAKYAIQYVNLTRKLEFVTWGKVSKKAGDYGWLKSIPSWAVKQFPVGGALPMGVYTTPLAALNYSIAQTELDIARLKNYLAEESDQSEVEGWQREIGDHVAQLNALKRRLAKLTTK